VADEPWASIYYWYISEDPSDGTVYGLEEYVAFSILPICPNPSTEEKKKHPKELARLLTKMVCALYKNRYATEKHHLEGHNTSKPFLHLVDTVGKASSKENKLKLEYLEPVLGFTERNEPTKAGVVRVERLTASEPNAVLDLLKPFATYVEQSTSTWHITCHPDVCGSCG